MTERGNEGLPPEALAASLATMTDSMIAAEAVGPVGDGDSAGLVETVARLRGALCVGPPPAILSARLEEEALAALGASQAGIGDGGTVR